MKQHDKLKEGTTINFKFGYSTGPYKSLPLGTPVIGIYDAEWNFIVQYYLEPEDVAKAKDWAFSLD